MGFKVSHKMSLTNICYSMYVSLYVETYLVVAQTFATTVYIVCDCILHILLLFSLRKSILSSTRNVDHFVLFVPFTCPQCIVFSITCCTICWSFGFGFAVFTCNWCTVIYITCSVRFACSCLFLFNQIKLVYLALFFLFIIFKVSLCTRALTINVSRVIVC